MTSARVVLFACCLLSPRPPAIAMMHQTGGTSVEMEQWVAARGGRTTACQSGLAYGAWLSQATPRLGEPLVMVLHAFPCGGAASAELELPIAPEHRLTRITIEGPFGRVLYEPPDPAPRAGGLPARVTKTAPATAVAHLYYSAEGPPLMRPGKYDFIVTFHGVASPLTLHAVIGEPPPAAREAAWLLMLPELAEAFYRGVTVEPLPPRVRSLAATTKDARYAGYLSLLRGFDRARRRYNERANTFVPPDCGAAAVFLRRAAESIPDPVFAAKAASVATRCSSSSASADTSPVTRPGAGADARRIAAIRAIVARRFPFMAEIDTGL